MVGRFVDHDGGQVNLPAVRFGSISVMPTPIKQPLGKMADSFCIDLHSRTGYSGSPVFVYRTLGHDVEVMMKRDPKDMLFHASKYFALLGVHFSQFPELWEVVERARSRVEAAREPLITEGKYIRGLSGMTCVLPAWNILEVLNLPKLRERRRRGDEVFEERMLSEGPPPEPEAARPGAVATEDDWRDPSEAARLRDEMLKRTLNTPPKPRRKS